jgi:ADP-ribosyl-[dinitrogen reductase] hydrolase
MLLRNAIGGPWARNLDTDLDAIFAWAARTIVTLLEQHELAHLGITRLDVEVQRRGMEWLHLPIPDVSTPGPEFDAKWSAISLSTQARTSLFTAVAALDARV